MSVEELENKINSLWGLVLEPPTIEDFNKNYTIGSNGMLLSSIDINIETYKPNTYDEAITTISLLSTIVYWGWRKKLRPEIDYKTNQIIGWFIE